MQLEFEISRVRKERAVPLRGSRTLQSGAFLATSANTLRLQNIITTMTARFRANDTAPPGRA